MELMNILKGEYPNIHTSIWWYKLDSIDEVAEPDKWIKANPNIGKTVTYETYQLDVEKAEKNPSARNDILAKRFGIPMEGYTYYFTYEETLPHRKKTIGKCHVLSEQTCPKETTSAHLHFCSHCQMVVLELRLEIT